MHHMLALADTDPHLLTLEGWKVELALAKKKVKPRFKSRQSREKNLEGRVLTKWSNHAAPHDKKLSFNPFSASCIF